MELTEREKSLLLRALDKASAPAEAEKAAEALIASLRKRGISGYEILTELGLNSYERAKQPKAAPPTAQKASSSETPRSTGGIPRKENAAPPPQEPAGKYSPRGTQGNRGWGRGPGYWSKNPDGSTCWVDDLGNVYPFAPNPRMTPERAEKCRRSNQEAQERYYQKRAGERPRKPSGARRFLGTLFYFFLLVFALGIVFGSHTGFSAACVVWTIYVVLRRTIYYRAVNPERARAQKPAQAPGNPGRAQSEDTWEELASWFKAEQRRAEREQVEAETIDHSLAGVFRSWFGFLYSKSS